MIVRYRQANMPPRPAPAPDRCRPRAAGPTQRC